MSAAEVHRAFLESHGAKREEASWCVNCRKLGHSCPAQRGVDLCVFCEDGEPCPVAMAAARKGAEVTAAKVQTAKAAEKENAMATGGKLKCPVCDKELGRTSFYHHLPAKHGWARDKAKEWIASHGPSEYSVARSGGKCSECSKALRSNNRSGRCEDHRIFRKSSSKSKPAPVQRCAAQPPAPVVSVGHTGNGAGVATICVTERALDQWWTKQPIQSKADIFSLAMAEEEGTA